MTKEIPAKLSVVKYVPYDIALKHYNRLCKLEAIESEYHALVSAVRYLWADMCIEDCLCHAQTEGLCRLCMQCQPERQIRVIRRHLKNRKAQQNGDVDERVFNSLIWEMEGMTARACNLLVHMDAQTIGELIHLSREDLLKQRNCGKKTAAVIEKALAKLGLKLSNP